MSVVRNAAGTIVLSGACPVDEAEALLRLLQETPQAALDWTQSSHLHSAVLQLILATGPDLVGTCGDPFVARWFHKAL
ncbi:hypothetical protein [Rhodopseudomonas palustris]|uniref:Uncharacterized protein n=1 Tax=Rhodopseudomonas palustris (strain BisB18) TaxID=316056 RepID=Q20XK8_RHOPB